MRPHRFLPPGFLWAGMIFLFITAFDPWPTQARAAVPESPDDVCAVIQDGGEAPALATEP